MGCEIGQFDEWNERAQIEWQLLDYDSHRKLREFIRDLNRLYLAQSELWAADDNWSGFEWVEVDNADESIIAFRRINRQGEALLTAVNFTPVERDSHLLRVPKGVSYQILLDSSDEQYGGYKKASGMFCAKAQEDGSYAIRIDLPAFGALILKETLPAKKDD